MKTNVIEFAIDTAIARCKALKEEIAVLEEEDWPSNGPKLLINFSKKLIEKVERYLSDIDLLDEDFKYLDPGEKEEQVKRYCWLVPYIHDALGYLEGAKTQEIPNEIVRPFNRLAREQISPNAELIIRTKPFLNYSYLSLTRRLRTVFEEDAASGVRFTSPNYNGINDDFLTECLGDLPTKLILLEIPKVEKENVLFHCILSHELGHGLFEEEHISQAIRDAIKIDKEIISKISDDIIVTVQSTEISRAPGKEEPKPIIKQFDSKRILTSLTSRLFNTWLKELAADSLALLLLGPAYFFSFISIVPSFQLLDSPSETHPIPRLRIKLLVELLKTKIIGDNSYYSIYKNENGSKTPELIEDWGVLCSNRPELKDPIYNICVEILWKQTKRLNEITTRLLKEKGSIYKPADLKKDIKIVANMLGNNIPGSEGTGPRRINGTSESTPVTLRSILNAGWEVLISKKSDFVGCFSREFESDVEITSQLNSLLLKSIDLSEIKSRWQDAKKVLDIK